MNTRFLLILLLTGLTTGQLIAADAPAPKIIANGGKRVTKAREITIEPAGGNAYPQILVDSTPLMRTATVLPNPGKTFAYTLPDRDGQHQMYFQFADGAGKPQGQAFFTVLELDRLAPVVNIESPQANVTTDQAFVHVKATVFDPEPTKPQEAPMMSRRISVWLNGEAFWNKQGNRIDIPRFPVNPGSNTLTLAVSDEAGNRTEATVNWLMDASGDKVAPVLSHINLQPDKTGTIRMPDVPQVWVQGEMDDPHAVVATAVNGGEPQKMNIRAKTFGYLIPLPERENQLVITATDAAGNHNDYKFTVVRANYRAVITEPPMGKFTQGRPPVVKGYVSAKRDAGTPTEATLTSVAVNGVPTVLGAVDKDGNIPFTTTQPVPAAPGGRPTSLNVEIHWSDGDVMK